MFELSFDSSNPMRRTIVPMKRKTNHDCPVVPNKFFEEKYITAEIPKLAGIAAPLYMNPIEVVLWDLLKTSDKNAGMEANIAASMKA